MTPLTFLQQMAVAIAGAGGDRPEIAWQHMVSDGDDLKYLARARQVLSAMPVPTEAMIDAMFKAHALSRTVFADPRDMWRMMLEAAAEQDQVPAHRRRGDPNFRPAIGGVNR